MTPSHIIRMILEGKVMPRQRYQVPTIKQRKDGCYYIRPYIDEINNETGKIERVKQRLILGDSSLGKRGSIQKRNEVMQTINRADYIIKSQINFGAMLERYDLGHIAKLKTPSQLKYRALIKKHIRPAFEHKALCELTTQKLQEWLDTRKLAPMSRKDLRNILSSVFRCAKIWGLYQDSNPLEMVIVRGGPQREKRKLTDEQTRTLLAALAYDLRVLCCVALFCTLRISEIFGLQEKHLDFESGLIMIKQRYYRGGLDVPKTANGKRDVPMGYLAPDLRSLCTGDLEHFIFSIKTKGRFGREPSLCRDDRSLLQHFIRPVAKKLGLYYKGFGFHSLRREAITSISANAGISQAMVAGGHGTMDMSILYTLENHREQDKAIREHQDRILGKAAGGVQ